MDIRQPDPAEVSDVIDELWIPFAQEMERLDEYNALADDIRDDAIAHRKQQLSNDDCRTLVASEGETLVGLSAATLTEPAPVFDRGTDLSISEVYVQEDYRGQGIATALLDDIEAWGEAQGCETMSLSVNVDNRPARTLYEKRGFEPKKCRYVKTRG